MDLAVSMDDVRKLLKLHNGAIISEAKSDYAYASSRLVNISK